MEETFGPDISQELAAVCLTGVCSGLAEGTIKVFLEKYPKPHNVKTVKVPRVNAPILQKIKQTTKANDLLMQKTQGNVLLAFPILSSMDMLLARRYKTPDLEKLAKLM